MATYSAFNALPPELISHMFKWHIGAEIACDCLWPIPFKEADEIGDSIIPNEVHTLGMVCRLWRDISRSTPQLWCNMVVKVDRKGDFAAVLERIEGYVSLAKDVQLSLYLCEVDTPNRWRSNSNTAADTQRAEARRAFHDFLYRHAKRWRQLQLELPWGSPLFESDIAFPNLQKMTLFDGDGQDNLTLRPELFPKLTMFGFVGLPLLRTTMQWDRLTVLDTFAFSKKDIFHVLSRTPSLIAARILYSEDEDEQVTPDDAGTTVRVDFPLNLPVLHSLDMVIDEDGEIDSVVKFIKAPNLKRLRCLTADDDPPALSVKGLASFLDIAKCTLEVLIVDGPQDSEENIVYLDGIRDLLPNTHIIRMSGEVEAEQIHHLWLHWNDLCPWCRAAEIGPDHDCREGIRYIIPQIAHDRLHCAICPPHSSSNFHN